MVFGKPSTHEEAVTDVGDGKELAHDHGVSELLRHAETGDKKRKGMEHAAETGRNARYRARRSGPPHAGGCCHPSCIDDHRLTPARSVMALTIA
jgi:hypothetical protein